MATKAKDSSSSSSLKKEKKATPSSSSHANTQKQANSRSAATTNSIDRDKPSLIPAPSGKSLPNYLRPTYSSRSESLKLSRKTTNEDSAQKLLRRRSFDRPPPALRAQKSLISPDPKERSVTSRDRIPNRPSSSSSVSASRIHTSTNNKPVLERNSKSLKPIRSPHQPHAVAGTIRSTSLSKNSHSLLKPPSIPEPQYSAAQEAKQEISDESLVQEADEASVNVDERPDVLQVEKNDEDVSVEDDSQVKEGIEEDEKVENSEIHSAEEAASDHVSQQLLVGENERELLREPEDDNRNIEGDHQGIIEESNEYGILDDTEKVDTENEHKEEENVNEKAGEEAAEETKNISEVSEEIKSKEGDNEEAVQSTGNVEERSAAGTTQKKQGGQGKKESPAAYNDVIEETKNKLLEKRKNRVKALVGAFETVIDYETAAGSNK